VIVGLENYQAAEGEADGDVTNIVFEITMKFDLDLNTIDNTPGGRDGFAASFKTELAAALGIPTNRIIVVSITPGSIAIVFQILPPATPSDPSAEQVFDDILDQMDDPTSELRNGAITGTVDTSFTPIVKQILINQDTPFYEEPLFIGVAAAAVVLGGIWFCWCRKKRKERWDMDANMTGIETSI